MNLEDMKLSEIDQSQKARECMTSCRGVKLQKQKVEWSLLGTGAQGRGAAFTGYAVPVLQADEVAVIGCTKCEYT